MAATCTAFEQELFNASTGGAAGTNLQTNPSGESGTPSIVVLQASSGGQAASSVVDSTAWAKSGTHSSRCQITRTDSGVGLVARAAPVGTGGIAVDPTHYYAMRATFRLVSISGGPATLALVRSSLYCYVAGGGAASPAFVGGPIVNNPAPGDMIDLYGIFQPSPSSAFGSPTIIFSTLANGGNPQLVTFDADAFMFVDLGTGQPASSGATTDPMDVPAYFEGQRVNAFGNPARGLMSGANYKLRQAYLRGITDPLAHQMAKSHPKQLKALQDNGKLASFDAITAP